MKSFRCFIVRCICALGPVCWIGTTSGWAGSIELQSNGVPNGAITVAPGDTDRSDWGAADILPYTVDSIDDAGPELDYVGVVVANDETNIYFRFGLQDNTPETPEFFGFRHNVYLDTDRNRDTGFVGSGSFLAVGAEYLLQGSTLFRFAGADPEQWGWAEIIANPWDDSPTTDIETMIPIASIDGVPEFDFIINGANSDFATEDFYPDSGNAGVSGDYFTYELGFASITDFQGDFDRDRDYSCADVDGLVNVIIAGTNETRFDVTSDNVVDDNDLAEWLAIAGRAETALENPYLPGDANLDGAVDAQDLNRLALNWRASPNAWCGGDFTADGIVDAADLNIIGLNWQKSSTAAAVPEPSGCWLAGFASLIVLASRTRFRPVQTRRAHAGKQWSGSTGPIELVDSSL